MKVITVSEEQYSLLKLLQTIDQDGVILQTIDGRQFILSPFNGWHGFEIQNTEDFEQEVKSTSENSELIDFLASRNQNKKRVSIAEVKEQLGIKLISI